MYKFPSLPVEASGAVGLSWPVYEFTSLPVEAPAEVGLGLCMKSPFFL